MSARIERTAVFDETTGQFLRRVAATRKRLRAEEYTLDEAGLFRFSSTAKGHKIQVTYDVVGPRVMLLNQQKRVRA